MDVLVIHPGHGSLWLERATYIDGEGRVDPDGLFVRGTNWHHEGGSYLPDGGLNIPETMTYPRRLIIKVAAYHKALAAPAPLDGLLAEIETGAAVADHGSVEDGPAFARGARWAASLIALRAALREGET